MTGIPVLRVSVEHLRRGAFDDLAPEHDEDMIADVFDHGEVVTDEHVLFVPSNHDATYWLAVGLYDPVSGQRLPVQESSGDFAPDDALRLGEVMLP